MRLLNYTGTNDAFRRKIDEINHCCNLFANRAQQNHRITITLYIHSYRHIDSLYTSNDEYIQNWVRNNLQQIFHLVVDINNFADRFNPPANIPVNIISAFASLKRNKKEFEQALNILLQPEPVPPPVPDDMPDIPPNPPPAPAAPQPPVGGSWWSWCPCCIIV